MFANNTNKINFGIVGCGAISFFHANALENIENANLYAVYDEYKDNSERLAKKANAKIFNNLQEMLSDNNIDAICVCTPSFLHYSIAMQCLKQKKHVLVEKPLALTSSECDNLIIAAKENNVILSAVSQLRFSEDFTHVKNAIKCGALGIITRCDVVMKYTREQSYYNQSEWRGTWEKDGGGALMNQGIHGIDLALYLMGDVKSIFAQSSTLARDIEVEDTLSAVMIWQNGAHGILQASVADYPGFERKIEINGSEGYIIIKENKICEWQFKNELYKLPNCKDFFKTASHNNPTAIDKNGHVAQIKNFIGAINNNEILITPAEDAAKAVKLINAAYESAKNGTLVLL